MKKKALSLLLAVVMIIGTIPTVALTAFAETANSVKYRFYDENLKAFDTRYRNCTVITEDDDEWDEGWYVVYGEVAISDRVTVSEDVHLILADGCKLTCEKGIQVETSWSPFEDDASLTIYAQSDDSNPNKGKLKATGDDHRAGIGSGELVNMFYGDITGDITIHGGYVEACGGDRAAGIGGGLGGNGGNVTIYGGEISAWGGYLGAGIGGGVETLYHAGGEGGNVKVYGGNVFAKAGEGSSAIGGGAGCDGGEFALYGGYVFADGVLHGSSIGGGVEGEGGKTSFYGGTLRYSITIGKGFDCDGSNGSIEVGEGLVLVNDKGNVINEGFKHIPWEEYLVVPRYSFSVLPSGKPITYMEYDDLFGYTESKCDKYTIVGKDTKVWGNGWYYVIDSGTFTDPVTVTGDAHLIISDTNTLKALGGIRVEKGASLSIYSQSEGDRQGELVVSAPANTAGIGGGNGKDGGTVRIHGCDISVTGGRRAAAIGGGNGANGGTLSLFGGKVTAAAGAGASRAFGAGSGGSDNGTVEVREGFELSDSVSGKTISREDSLASGWASLLDGTYYTLTLVQETLYANDPVSYLYHGEDLDLFSATQTLYRFIREDSQTLNSGWYVADGTLTLDHPLSVIGDVHLILKDGSSLTVNGLCVNEGYSLSVYAQSEDESEMGVLNSYGEDLYAGIGSAISSNTGDITIHGGRITAQGGRMAAGIGGGFLFGCGNIKIHGGIVNAESTAYGAGIGSGMADYDYSYEYDEYEGDIIELIAYGSNGTIEITGGTVNAVGNGMGAGIGGGYNGTNGDIEINNVKKLTASGFRGIGAGQKMTSSGTVHVGDELLMKAGSSEDDAIEVEEIGDDAYITITPDVPVFKFDSVALVLSGELGLNFYTVVNDVEAVKDGYMLFEIGNSGDTQKVFFKDLTAEDDGRYIFRCNVNVLQMADTITAGFHYGDEVVGPRTTSVAQYLKNIVAKDPDNEELAALAHAIENYGHYAQIALQEVHGFTLGEDGKYQTMAGYGDIVLPDAADLADYKATKTGSITKISNVSRALALDHGTDILLYFTCADGYTPTATVTDKDGNAVACSLTKDESGRYVLTIQNISAHKLGDFYTVSVDGGAMTINISALSYAYSILNSATSSENLKYAVAALYNYYQAAIAYQAAHE